MLLPFDPDETMNAAAQEFSKGRLDEAARLAAQVLDIRPGDLAATMMQGVIAVKQARPAEAVPLLSEVARRDPASFEVHYWLSRALRRVGRPIDARSVAERALSLKPGDPMALHQLGLCCMDHRDWSAAAAHLQQAANIAPNDATTYANLGIVFEALTRSQDAKQAYFRSLEIDPMHPQALQRLGQILLLEVDYDGAADCARRILKLDPNSAFGHSLLAVTLAGHNRPNEAAEHAARALELEPDRPETLTLYGTILQTLGRMDEAESHLRRSVDLAPLQGYAYYALVRTHKLEAADLPMVEHMEQVCVDPLLAPQHRGDLEYAVGKARADLGDLEASMRHYDTGNRVTRQVRFGRSEFDRAKYAWGTDFAIRMFTPELFERSRGGGLSDNLPIVVVGMMRSGTTLVEQILSCHPGIGPAGEQRFWMDNGPTAIEASANKLDAVRLRSLAAEYLDLLKRIAPGKTAIVDKMPGNYVYLGLIHAALPNARVIHLRRNPVDTCLSIWMTPNSTSLQWANNKGDLVFVYKEYLRFMEHWQEAIPSDRLLSIDYETLVTDPEATTRRILEFCGMDWDERCLRPEQNRRSVATPSAWQVRQPVYRTAVERWRSFEPWLGEFRELLAE